MSDQQGRAVYDQSIEGGSKGQMPPPDSGGRYSARISSNEDDQFSESFRFWGPFGGMGDTKGATGEEFASFPGGGGGGREGTTSSSMQRKGTAIEWNLMCSLEELYKGTTKKLKITKDVIDAAGRISTMEEIVEIKILPGWKKGTKIIFPEKVHEQQGIIPSDLVFIISEKPHSVFKRHKNDLIITKKISLVESLTGFTVQITTLDGRNLTVPITSIVSPISEEIVEGEGMPIPKEPTKRGNLRIKFNVKYPRKLTQEQKTGIKRLLAS